MGVWLVIIAAIFIAIAWVSQISPGGGRRRRRDQSKPKPRTPSSGQITDPRLAAFIPMLEVCGTPDTPSVDQGETILLIANEVLGMEPQAAVQALSEIIAIRAATPDKDAFYLDMIDVISSNVSRKQVIELDEVLVRLSEVEGLPTPLQMRALQIFRTQTGVMA